MMNYRGQPSVSVASTPHIRGKGRIGVCAYLLGDLLALLAALEAAAAGSRSLLHHVP